MSDPAKKVKKVKEEKVIDYSRTPDHIWEKELASFCELCENIAQRLAWMERSFARIAKHAELEAQKLNTPPKDVL